MVGSYSGTHTFETYAIYESVAKKKLEESDALFRFSKLSQVLSLEFFSFVVFGLVCRAKGYTYRDSALSHPSSAYYHLRDR